MDDRISPLIRECRGKYLESNMQVLHEGLNTARIRWSQISLKGAVSTHVRKQIILEVFGYVLRLQLFTEHQGSLGHKNAGLESLCKYIAGERHAMGGLVLLYLLGANGAPSMLSDSVPRGMKVALLSYLSWCIKHAVLLYWWHRARHPEILHPNPIDLLTCLLIAKKRLDSALSLYASSYTSNNTGVRIFKMADDMWEFESGNSGLFGEDLTNSRLPTPTTKTEIKRMKVEEIDQEEYYYYDNTIYRNNIATPDDLTAFIIKENEMTDYSTDVGKAFPEGSQRIFTTGSSGELSIPVSSKYPGVITDEQLESIGQDLSKKLSGTTEKILSTMNLGKFDELGDILLKVQTESSKLDPKTLARGGIVGWWQRHFLDVKKHLTKRFKAAEEVFAAMESNIGGHIDKHRGWIRDMDSLYEENHARWVEIGKVIGQLEDAKGKLEETISGFELPLEGSEEYVMKVQERNDLRALSNRIDIRIDNFKRLRVIAESNAPRIRGQQQTSRDSVEALRQVVDMVNHTVKSDFALFLHSLDAKNSAMLISSARGMINHTLKSSADTASETAIESTKNANTAMVTFDTLNHIRDKALSTVKEVRRIQEQAQEARRRDSELLVSSQKKYLEEMNKAGGI